jgi:hypothetical protein
MIWISLSALPVINHGKGIWINSIKKNIATTAERQIKHLSPGLYAWTVTRDKSIIYTYPQQSI